MRPSSLALALVVASCSSPSSGTPAAPHPLAMAMPAAALTTGPLEIHQINVQQGDCTLIVGPDETIFLIDAGNVGKGTAEVVPYLQSIGIIPGRGRGSVAYISAWPGAPGRSMELVDLGTPGAFFLAPENMSYAFHSSDHRYESEEARNRRCLVQKEF